MEVIETERLKEDAGKVLTEVLRAHAQKPILLMLSGGSALSVLEYVKVEIIGSHITITVLDERFSLDSTINNFTQLEQTAFYAACVERNAHFIPTKVSDGDSIEKVRDRFDSALHKWKEQHPDGVIIATMGIGKDGHTAGIFPGKYAVDFNGGSWVSSYNVPNEVNPYPDRITVTNTFLREQVDEAILIVTGGEKAQIFKELYDLLQQGENKFEKPMSVILKMKKVILCTDLKL